ncbi:MAG TPA: reverse transcriptase family protein, partial [Polyangiaceae bacterium]|nr:reverse transcriptase family protein [Polyangiaceae bacterium]
MLPLRFSDLRNVQLICAHLQTTPRALQSFLREPDRYYKPIDLPQVPWRRPRRVFEVGAPLRRIHRVLAVALAQHVHEQPSYIQGFRSGRSIRSNAAMHVNAEVVVAADIRGFFDEIDVERVTSLFQRLGAPFQAATLLARLSTFQGHLPQGGRASPAISNLAVPDLDKALVRLGGRCAYTRYADDITFSGTAAACPTEDQLRGVLESCGFQLRP